MIGSKLKIGMLDDSEIAHLIGIKNKIIRVITAGTKNTQTLSLNFSLIVVPVTTAAATEVSEIKERLSPAITPLTTTPHARGILISE